NVLPGDLRQIFEIRPAAFAGWPVLIGYPQDEHDEDGSQHNRHEQVPRPRAVSEPGGCLRIGHGTLVDSPAEAVTSPSFSLPSRPCSLCRIVRTASLMVSMSTMRWNTWSASVTMAKL